MLDFQVSGKASGEASVENIVTKVRGKGSTFEYVYGYYMSIYIYWSRSFLYLRFVE